MTKRLYYYPRIFKFRDVEVKKAIERLKGDIPFVVQEKIDGSFYWINYDATMDVLTFGSKNRRLDNIEKLSMFSNAVRVTNEIIYPKLKVLAKKGYFTHINLFCEYLNKPTHNALKYDRIPRNHLILFDVFIDDLVYHHDQDKIEKMANALDIEPIPFIYVGKEYSEKKAHKWLKRESVLGGVEIEGFVLKVNVGLIQYCSTFVIKQVSEKFKEVKTQPKSKKTYKLDELFDKYKTEARWKKAIQHLAETGELSFTVNDIGKIIKEVQKDIEKEEKENIKNDLYKMFRKPLFKYVTKGIYNFYIGLLEEMKS